MNYTKEEKEAMIKKSCLDYSARGLDFCQFCGKKYNVGARIPRIMVHCGHTFCTDCLSKIHKKNRVRCPLCTKLIKNVESVEKLPLNMNILYEVIEKDKTLAEIEYDFENDDEMNDKLCDRHEERIKHFYCSNHLTIFCRECIKEDHTDTECFVVDLYEIQKMKDLQRENMKKNQDQIDKMGNGVEFANCKGPKGNKKLNFTNDFTLQQLVELISSEMEIDTHNVAIKMGYPPKLLSSTSLEILCSNVGIKDKETILVVDDNAIIKL